MIRDNGLMDEALQDRSNWPVRRRRLDEEGQRDERLSSAECIAMMWPLAVEAWTMAGRPIPDYERDQMPSRLIRPTT